VTEVPDKSEQRSWLSFILADVHFWVPLIVLVGGLLLLAWVS
jgi:hypothetical protein